MHRPVPPSRELGLASVLLLALTAMACSKDLTITLRAGDRPPNPDPESNHPVSDHPTASLKVVAGIAVDRVQIVMRDIRFQSNPTADGSAAPGDDAVSPPLLLVDLTGTQLGDGAMTEIVAARDVSWESFYQTILDLRPVTADEVAGDPRLAPLLDRTLVINGRLPGDVAFTFVSSIQAVLLRPSVFRVGTNHNNLTLNLALNRWFVGADGKPLDPRDPAASAAIEANILESIDVYMDDDRNGQPDCLG
jgi:hypothetical protein